MFNPRHPTGVRNSLQPCRIGNEERESHSPSAVARRPGGVKDGRSVSKVNLETATRRAGVWSPLRQTAMHGPADWSWISNVHLKPQFKKKNQVKHVLFRDKYLQKQFKHPNYFWIKEIYITALINTCFIKLFFKTQKLHGNVEAQISHLLCPSFALVKATVSYSLWPWTLPNQHLRSCSLAS